MIIPEAAILQSTKIYSGGVILKFVLFLSLDLLT